jgi:hypothetical protein
VQTQALSSCATFYLLKSLPYLNFLLRSVPICIERMIPAGLSRSMPTAAANVKRRPAALGCPAPAKHLGECLAWLNRWRSGATSVNRP